MAYTIDETNAERQRLLAEVLDPLTQPALGRIPKNVIHEFLDLGCGQGHTTRFLARSFPGASGIGLEYDSSLVAHAARDSHNPPGIAFRQGDASELPFPDASFDLVFTRYMLVHVSDPSSVLREMFRVTRPGGFVVAYEPDCSMEFSYPPNVAIQRMSYVWSSLFPNPLIGRQLVHLFRAAGAKNISAGAVMGMDHSGDLYKRIYRITAEAVGSALIAKQRMTADEVESLIASARELEADPDAVLFKMPDVWVVTHT